MWVLIDNNSMLIIDSEALELFAVAPEFQLVVEFVAELEALVHLVHGAKAAHADLSHTSQFPTSREITNQSILKTYMGYLGAQPPFAKTDFTLADIMCVDNVGGFCRLLRILFFIYGVTNLYYS